MSAIRVGEGKEFLVVMSASQQGGKSHQHIFTLQGLLPYLLRGLHNQFVFTNSLWPTEVWRVWGQHQPANWYRNWRQLFSRSLKAGCFLPGNNTDSSSGGREVADSHCGTDLAEGKVGKGKRQFIFLQTPGTYSPLPPHKYKHKEDKNEREVPASQLRQSSDKTTLTLFLPDSISPQSVSRENKRGTLIKISPFYCLPVRQAKGMGSQELDKLQLLQTEVGVQTHGLSDFQSADDFKVTKLPDPHFPNNCFSDYS